MRIYLNSFGRCAKKADFLLQWHVLKSLERCSGFGGVALVVSLGKKRIVCPVSVEVSLFVPRPPQSPKDGDKPALSFLIVLSKKQFSGNLLFRGKKDHYVYWLQWMRSSLGRRTRDCKYPPSFRNRWGWGLPAGRLGKLRGWGNRPGYDFLHRKGAPCVLSLPPQSPSQVCLRRRRGWSSRWKLLACLSLIIPFANK